jgi:hypothetical protein
MNKPAKPSSKTPPAKHAGGRPRVGGDGAELTVQRTIRMEPRKWEFLDAQPDGAVKTIRRLVDEEQARVERKANK